MINTSNLVRLTVLSFLLAQLSCIKVVNEGSIIFSLSEDKMGSVELEGVAEITMDENESFTLTDSQGNITDFTPEGVHFSQYLNYNGRLYEKDVKLDSVFLAHHHSEGSSGYNIKVYVECEINNSNNDEENDTFVLIRWTFDNCKLISDLEIECNATGSTGLEACPDLDEEDKLGAYIDVHDNCFWVHFTKKSRILI